jgi:predicted Zn-dependent peptidase
MSAARLHDDHAPQVAPRVRVAAVAVAALMASGCGGVAARPGETQPETLPGRTRPVLEHGWTHPRDLTFAENRFTPPDPEAALVTTASGVRAYVVPDPTQRVVGITAAVPLGRTLEQANEIGGAELLSRLLSQQIDDRLGPAFQGEVQVDQEMDLTRFTLQVLSEDWRSALSALVATLREPHLDPVVIEAYRTGPGFSRQTRGLGGPAFRPAVELSRLVAAYPIAPPDPGLSVRREAVRYLASRALRPGAIAVGVGGGITREAVDRELHALTAGWQSAAGSGEGPQVRTAVNAASNRFRSIEEPGYTTWIAVGHPLSPIDPADEAAVAVLTDLVNIRLTIAVREIRGLANATQLVVPATTRHGGLLHVRSGARPESIAPIIRFSLEELTRIREPAGAPSAEELEQVKGGIVLGKWQGLLDGALDASATYAAETARFGSLDHLLKWPTAVRAVTSQAVSAAAQKYINPSTVSTVVIGQVEEARKARHPRWPVGLDEVTGKP